MRVSGKKVAICGILLSQVFCGQVFAGGDINNPCYQNMVDTENSNFEEGEWKYRFTASSGESMMLEEGKRHTFLIINGSISSEKIVIENGRSYIGIDGICKELGLSKRETGDAITVENSINRIILDKKTLLLRKGEENLGIKGRVIEGEVFVPIKDFSGLFHAAVTYSEAGMMPMSNPLVNIDNREKSIAKEQALQIAEQKMQEYYQKFEPKHIYGDKGLMDDMMLQIQDGINHMQYMGETASFWIVKGPCLLFMDKSTGAIYYKTGNGKAGHGSYLEAVQDLDGNADGLFEHMLISGF